MFMIHTSFAFSLFGQRPSVDFTCHFKYITRLHRTESTCCSSRIGFANRVSTQFSYITWPRQSASSTPVQP